MDLTVRRARAADHDRVASVVAASWPDRDLDDYVADVFPEWVRSDGPAQRTLVAEADGVVVAVMQASLLTSHEGWLAGLRVDPDHRGAGVATRLTATGFDWLRDRDAAVARNVVFSWNIPSLGLARRAGFAPRAEFRFAHPDPDPAADPALAVDVRPDAGWAFWTASDARTALAGLALDGDRPWALSELTRADLRAAADDGRLLTVHGDGTRALALRTRLVDPGDDESVTWAEYGVGAWADAAAARALCRAVARDAAAAGADRTRLLVPEGVGPASDLAAARVPLADAPDFVLAADLSDPAVGGESQGT